MKTEILSQQISAISMRMFEIEVEAENLCIHSFQKILHIFNQHICTIRTHHNPREVDFQLLRHFHRELKSMWDIDFNFFLIFGSRYNLGFQYDVDKMAISVK